MRVQTRLLIISAILATVFIAGFFVVQQSQRTQMIGLAATQKSEMEKYFRSILNLEEQEMHTIVFDYTYWDELVAFVKTGDSNFAHNILDTSLASYKVNAIWVYNPQLELVYSTANLPGNVAPPLPFSDQEIKNLFQDSAFNGFSFRLPDGIVMDVRGATIHPSNDVAHQSPLEGYFFAGRVMSAERLANLSNLAGAAVEVVRVDQINAQTAPPTALVADVPIPDHTGTPLAYIRANFPNVYLEGFQQAQQRDLTIYVVTTSLMFILVTGVLLIGVARPLARITTSLTQHNPLLVQALERDTSEFGNIAHLIVDFFDQRKEMARQIRLLEDTRSALQSSELRYRTLAEISSDATYSLLVAQDGSIQIEWGAESMARIAGCLPEEPIEPDQILTIFFPPDRFSAQNWGTLLSAGTRITQEYRITARDGEILWIRNHLQPAETLSDQTTLRVYGAAQDISVEKNAEEAYHTLVDHALQGLAIFQNGHLVFANQAFLKMSGDELEELYAQSSAEILARVDIPSSGANQRLIADFLSGDFNSIKLRLRFLHKNDSWRWLDVACDRVEYHGKPAIQAACVEITEQIQSEEALQEQTSYSQMIFSSVGTPVLILEPNGRIVEINPACEQLIGKNSSELKELYLWDVFLIPPTAPMSEERFCGLVETLTVINSQEIQLSGAGPAHWLSWSQRYQLDAAGKVAYILGSAIDITERVMRERLNAVTAHIMTALQGNITREETISTLLEVIRELLPADSVGMVFPIEDRDELLIECMHGDCQESLQGKRVPVSDSALGLAWQSSQTNGYLNMPIMRGTQDLNSSRAPGSAVWAALRQEGENMGMLLALRNAPFNQIDLDLLLPIAAIAASAIERAVRVEQDRLRVQQLSALQSIYLGIVTSLDLNFTLNMIVMQTTSQLGIDAVDMLLLNPQTQMLHFAAQSGFRSHEIEKTQLWLGESQAGRVAMERRSRHLYDPDGIASYFIPDTNFLDEDFIAYDAIPLVVKGEVKGVLEIFHRAPYNTNKETQELLEALALLTAIAIDHSEIFEQLQRRNQDLRITFEATIESWARSLELWDYETKRHSIRVVTLTEKLAQWMGISGDALTNIRRGALLHDIGKIGIPDRIYQKPTKLSPDEWAVIVKHPEKAYEILNSIPFLKSALDIVYGHHERWNGSGYPLGLAGEQIPLAARIFAVVDIFDALMSSRSYKGAWSEEQALNYLKDTAGRELDPKIVDAFLSMYPILKMSHLLDDLYPKEDDSVQPSGA